MERFVFLHGFTQTHHHWHAVAQRLADLIDPTPTLAFVDLPGHGLAGDDLAGDIDSIGERLVRLAGRGTYVGYSMGGRIALVAAATGAAEIERLVLIGATPGLTDPVEREDRRRLDDQRAQHLEAVGVATFVDEWLAMPMFERLPTDDDGLAHRRRNTVAGLAHSLRRYGTGSQTPLWEVLPTIRVPVLVVAGERDDKFVGIARRMAETLPDATLAVVPEAGHAPHLDHPTALLTVLSAWIRA